MNENLNSLYFSQSALNTFRICSLKFKRKYIDGLIQSDKYDDSIMASNIELGRLFHLTAERYFLGIPTGVEDIAEDQLVQWMKILIKTLPLEKEKRYYTEYEIHLNGKMKLQAKYDLIIKKEDGKFCIYDWKTERKPLKMEKYKNSLQTILYCFLLVEAGEKLFGKKINPEDVEMIYWQPSNSQVPLVIKYSEDQYLKDKLLLENLVSNIMTYDFENITKKDIDTKLCKNCDLKQMCT